MTIPVNPIDPRDRDLRDPDPVPSQSELVRQDEVVEEQRVIERPAGPVVLPRLVWLLAVLLEAFIGIRVILKLIAANPANPFASFVYSFTNLFLWPFSGLTATPAADGMVLEISSIIAMFVYALIAWGVVELISIVLYPSRRQVRIRDRRTRV